MDREEMDDFSTIEYDFLQTKDYFNNYKFTYREKKSKCDFFLNIHNVSVENTRDMLEDTKNQLKQVKQQYKMMDEEIKNLSREIYEIDIELEKEKNELKNLGEEESILKEKCAFSGELHEKIEIGKQLQYELASLGTRIETLEADSDGIRNKISTIRSKNLGKKIEDLNLEKKELTLRQRRMSIMNNDHYIEDVYLWYNEMKKLMCTLFGKVNIKKTSRGSLMIEVEKNGKSIRIETNNGNLVEYQIEDQIGKKESFDFEIDTHLVNYLIFKFYKDLSREE